jgi:hypothetical protein
MSLAASSASRIIEDYYREAKYELVHYQVSTTGSIHISSLVLPSGRVDPDSVKGVNSS